LSNLSALTRHLIASEKQEKNVDFADRCKIQILKRGLELSNDVEWFLVGLLNQFAFNGSDPFTMAPLPLHPYELDLRAHIRAELTIFAAANDVTRAFVGLALAHQRYNSLIQEYDEKISLTIDEEEKKKLQELKTGIIKQRDIEYVKCSIRIARDAIILACNILQHPYFAAISPMIPLAVRILSVATTLIAAIVLYQLDKKPALPSFTAEPGFFAPKRKRDASNRSGSIQEKAEEDSASSCSI
jgi:hypothetical protein